MTRKISNFRLGLFVIVALAILIGLIVSIGGGNVFRSKVRLETYFDESVQGLDIGSKVRYRGVEIGAVRRIGFSYTEYEQNKPPAERKQYVLVEMDVYSDQLGDVGGGREFVARLVDNGLRVRMVPVGVTGIVYLELDFNRDNSPLPINWKPNNLYVASVHSTTLNFVESVQNILSKLEPLDLGGMVANFDRLLANLNKKVDALETEKLSSEITVSLAEFRKILGHVEGIVSDKSMHTLPADLAATVSRLRQIAESPELKRTLAALDQGAQHLDGVLERNEGDIADLVANLRAASVDLKSFSEKLKQNPAGTLLVSPPKPTDAFSR